MTAGWITMIDIAHDAFVVGLYCMREVVQLFTLDKRVGTVVLNLEDAIGVELVASSTRPFLAIFIVPFLIPDPCVVIESEKFAAMPPRHWTKYHLALFAFDLDELALCQVFGDIVRVLRARNERGQFLPRLHDVGLSLTDLRWNPWHRSSKAVASTM